MKKFLLLMTLFISVLSVGAQNTKVITGAVIDKNGNPLPNALVEATGGAESVTTDADGSFRIEVPVWLKSLTAKYAGMSDKTVKLDHTDRVIFEMKPVKKGTWFLDLAIACSVGDDVTYGSFGLMGGYLGNWGGYARLLVPSAGNVDAYIPSLSLGVIKHVYKPFYLYLGAGFACVQGKYDDYYYGSSSGHLDSEPGAIFDIGAIFKLKKVNFSLGYSFSSSFCCYDAHSLQLSVGYCF